VKRKIPVAITFDEELLAQAKALAKARGVSFSALVREALAQYIGARAGRGGDRSDPAAVGSSSAILERLDRIERKLGELERLLPRSTPAAAGSAPAAEPPAEVLPDFVKGNPWLSVIAGRGG
jgi:hypothetical protein